MNTIVFSVYAMDEVAYVARRLCRHADVRAQARSSALASRHQSSSLGRPCVRCRSGALADQSVHTSQSCCSEIVEVAARLRNHRTLTRIITGLGVDPVFVALDARALLQDYTASASRQDNIMLPTYVSRYTGASSGKHLFARNAWCGQGG